VARSVTRSGSKTFTPQARPLSCFKALLVVARRKRSDWFLGGMTNWTPRDLKVPLAFLGAGEYAAEIYEDGPDADQNPKHVVLKKQILEKTSSLDVHLAGGGGCAVRFTPLK